jgi:hypothetical protein
VLNGGSGDDVIVGYEGNDRISGGSGNDDLTWGNALAPVGVGTLDGGGGNDILRGGFLTPNMYGGAGDDSLYLGRFNPGPAGGAPPVIDGGSGFDTLFVFQRPAFDLTGLDGRNLSGIEKIDATGGSPVGTEITLDAASVLRASAETESLFIAGDVTDRVTAHGAWVNTSTQEVDGVTYHAWALSGAAVLIDTDISVVFA